MIPKVHDMGDDTRGLVAYLYGAGKAEEHIDPHLVAAWDSQAPDPGRDPKATYGDLQRLLDQPVMALPESAGPAEHVWHLSVRAAPEDPILTDEQWADIARRMVAATGIAPEGDEAACRWAAVRHADDHIHIVATVVREDGRQARIRQDGARSQTEARKVEIDYGLRRLNVGDGTAAKHPTSAERHKANRQGKERTPREELRETVRRAAAGVASEEEFFDRLAAAGLLIRQRTAPSGDVLGYKVALPDDRNEDQEPIYYSGSTLAPDLSLPRVRKRWAADASGHRNDATTDRSSGSPRISPSAARRQATTAVWQTVLILDQGDDGQIAAHLAAAGEVLDALAKTSAAHTRRELRDAAWAFERATRSTSRPSEATTVPFVRLPAISSTGSRPRPRGGRCHHRHAHRHGVLPGHRCRPLAREEGARPAGRCCPPGRRPPSRRLPGRRAAASRRDAPARSPPVPAPPAQAGRLSPTGGAGAGRAGPRRARLVCPGRHARRCRERRPRPRRAPGGSRGAARAGDRRIDQ